MNQKAYSVLFCALLASTFIHELRAKGVAPVSSRLEVFERAASTEVCELECQWPGGSDGNVTFGLTVEVVEQVLVIANLSANVAFLVNASAQIVVLLNGTSGAGIAIDLIAKTGVYIKTGLWVAKTISLEAWILSLNGGLKAIFSISGAVSFSLSSVSSEVLIVINEIIVKLIANIRTSLIQDAHLGLQLVLAIGGGLVVLLNGALKGLLGVFGQVAIHITNDLAGFLNVLQGFAIIVGAVGGSIAKLIELDVKFKLALILAAANGLEAFINIILQIGGAIDIGAALGELLYDAESFFKLIAQLGGNVAIGINGVFLVVSQIAALINKNVTIEVVISTIIQFVALSSQVVKTDLNEVLNVTLSGLLQAFEQVKLTIALSGVVKIVKDLINGSLVIGGINFSIIVKKLLTGIISGASSLLQVVAYVVLQFQAAIEIGLLVPYLLLVLLFKLNSAIGVEQLIALGFQLNISAGSIVGGFLKNILTGIVSILFGLLTGNFYDALCKISVFGDIIVALNAAFEAASSGTVSLKSFLNVSSLVKNLILGLIQFVSGVYLGVSSSVIYQVKAILEATTSVSASVHVNVTVGYSASISG